MTPSPSDGWETLALTVATTSIVGLALEEQFRLLPGAVLAHGAAWWIGRQDRTGSSVAPGGASG